jgi:hypothetical protein
MEDAMTDTIFKTLTLAVALGAITFTGLAGSPAEAGRAKRGVVIQEYTFDQPMDGFEGHDGGGYCSYQRIPQQQCSPISGKCKKVWILRQICQ